MYTKDGESYFIVDAHIALWDARTENIRNVQGQQFIDVDLGSVDARYVVPTVNIFSGEDFESVQEAFFGYMERPPEQQGRPYGPRTVRRSSTSSAPGA